ncbi:acid-sensing ion channel 1B-like [Ornithodoros turicata]|uniref:acid-sensing ion channel 1B-like n=1 Tax=Ornithodoros turicata TaxID=34597 RepID=UPI0031395069
MDRWKREEGAKERSTTTEYLRLLYSTYCQAVRKSPPIFGLGILCDPDTSRVRKLVWILVMLLLGGVATIGCGCIIVEYLEYDVTATFQRLSNSSMSFPDVTICNSNPWRKNQLCKENSWTLVDFNLTSQACSPAAEDLNLTYRKNLSHTLMMSLSKGETEKCSEESSRMSHQLEDMLVGCEFEHHDCRDKRYFMEVPTTSGCCYCFNCDAEPDSPFLTVTHSDHPEHGLVLTLDTEVEEYLPISREPGFVIMVHEHGTTAVSSADAVYVAANMITYIGLTVMALKGLPPPYKNPCSRDWPNRLLRYMVHVPKYTKEDCLSTCLQIVLSNVCQCEMLDLPTLRQLDETPITYCDDEYMECVSGVLHGESWDNVRWGKWAARDASPMRPSGNRSSTSRGKVGVHPFNDTVMDTMESVCGCYRPCESLIYDRRVTTSLLRSSEEPSDSEGGINKTRSLATVVVYFRSFQYDSVTTNPKYNAVELLSDLGAIIGMYMGLSFFVFFQFLELFVFVLLSIRRRAAGKFMQR